jgi:3-hydroxyisobutyrate dehydrogenase
MPQPQSVGFIGLGSIGVHMATNLVKAGFDEVLVYDIHEPAMKPAVEAGARAASSPKEVGERCDVIGICVVDDAGTESVLTGHDGILEGAKPGTVVAIHSTVHPETVQKLAIVAGEKDVVVIDAQMTGGPERAAESELHFMVGGDEAAIAKATPFLEASASAITHCGGLGMGAVAKLCNNLVQYIAWLGYTEAFRLAREAGLAKETLTEILSWIMNDNARTMMFGRDLLESDPDNAFIRGRFEATLNLAEKDLALALDVARKLGVSMPGTALTSQGMARVFAFPDANRR